MFTASSPTGSISSRTGLAHAVLGLRIRDCVPEFYTVNPVFCAKRFVYSEVVGCFTAAVWIVFCIWMKKSVYVKGSVASIKDHAVYDIMVAYVTDKSLTPKCSGPSIHDLLDVSNFKHFREKMYVTFVLCLFQSWPLGWERHHLRFPLQTYHLGPPSRYCLPLCVI